ncbi:MAG: thiamine-phosphate kinase [Desulfobacterales bacterium]|nr:thiamine-phosphate kinase [Desulfobacterales bacterium]
MLIKDAGGEFALIQRLSRIIPSNHDTIVAGIGDDAAVIKINPKDDQYLLVTTDTLVANDHFKTVWAKPEQIGIKTIECNVSDIAAMGGIPTYMFISLVLTPKTTVEWTERLYSGMALSCKKHNIITAGGDTTHGEVEVISITLLGTVSSKNLCLRSQAQPGDWIAVTGALGASSAGLNLLSRDLPVSSYLLEKHLSPHCRLDAAQHLAPIVNAMIDISDGLSSEINHICFQSKVGAQIFAESIPLHPDVIEAGKTLGQAPIDFALNGGEDYELLFTIAPENFNKLKQTGLKYYIVGKITDTEEGCYLITESENKIKLQGGYNHFT